MPPEAAAPCPPEVLASLVREHPPHRAPEAFFDQLGAWRRQVARPRSSGFEAILASLAAPEGSAAYAHADAMAVRSLLGLPADELMALVGALRDRWPAPSATRAGTIERIVGVAELARLRDAGRIVPGAVVRVAYLFDPARPPEPPDDVPAFFGEAPGTPAGLRAARDVLIAEAPVAWRLASREYARLVDRLDPPGRP